MKALPRMLNRSLRSEAPALIEELVAASATHDLADVVSDLGERVDERLNDSGWIEACHHPGVHVLVEAQDVIKVRRLVLERARMPDLGYPEPRPHGTGGESDRGLVEPLWAALRPYIRRGDAMNGELWGWLALRVFPDLVAWRFMVRSSRKLPNVARYSSFSDLRCWPMGLWWYGWLAANEDMSLHADFLDTLSRTDIRVGLLERTGAGLDRRLVRSFVAVLRAEPVGRRAHVARGMNTRLRWLRSTVDVESLSDNALESLMAGLAEWAKTHYRPRAGSRAVDDVDE